MGGDQTRDMVKAVLDNCGRDTTDLKLLFADSSHEVPGVCFDFQCGSPTVYYFFNTMGMSTHIFTSPNDLKAIVNPIDDAGRGIESLRTELVPESENDELVASTKE